MIGKKWRGNEENVRNEYYLKFLVEEQNILDNSKLEEESSGSIVQFRLWGNYQRHLE